DPRGRNGFLCRAREAHRRADRNPCGCAGLRRESTRRRDSMPSRRAHGWIALGLWLGRGQKESVARTRAPTRLNRDGRAALLAQRRRARELRPPRSQATRERPGTDLRVHLVTSLRLGERAFVIQARAL